MVPSSALTIRFSRHEFDARQLEIVIAAAEEWESTTRGRVKFALADSDECCPDIIIQSSPKSTLHAHGYRANTVYVFNVIGGTVTLPSDSSDDDLRALALHEIGHAIGLPHAACGDCVMAPHAPSVHVTCDDVAQFCEVNGCNLGD